MNRFAHAFALAFTLSVASVAFAQPTSLVTGEASTARPAFAALPSATRQLHLRWLSAGCGEGSDDYGLLLRAAKQPLDAAFAEAWRLGPPEDEIARLAASQHQGYAAFQARLAGPDAALFPPEMVADLRALSEDAYVSNAVALRTEGYRQAALAGLALTATARVLPWLRETVPQLDGEARDMMLRAIVVAERRASNVSQ